MSNFSINESMVRVDIFKPSGKWSGTKEVKWARYTGDIHKIFRESLGMGGSNYDGWSAVCLHPYHEHSHPLMLKFGE